MSARSVSHSRYAAQTPCPEAHPAAASVLHRAETEPPLALYAPDSARLGVITHACCGACSKGNLRECAAGGDTASSIGDIPATSKTTIPATSKTKTTIPPIDNPWAGVCNPTRPSGGDRDASFF